MRRGRKATQRLAADLAPVIAELKEAGVTGLRGVASALTSRASHPGLELRGAYRIS
jgi:hypothetical protein